MKITIVSTTDIRGGAAIAASRLFKTIHQYLPETRMLVQKKLGTSSFITELNQTFFRKAINSINFYFERISFIVRARSKNVWFDFSPSNFGRSISNLPEIKDAEIIHLHWVNHGFLSLRGIHGLAETGKKIVWTLHDMNTFTGGCHHSGLCDNYMKECGNCFFLKIPFKNDLSHRVYQRKLGLFNRDRFCFIAVSNWMAEKARKSSLIGNCRIEVIPNPLDTEIFKPAEKNNIRRELGLPNDKFLILFGAANVTDKRKGFVYLMQALEEIIKTRPEISQSFGLITFGKSGVIENFPVMLFPQAYLKDDQSVAMLYQAADMFITPTIEDNLPTTVMESLGCGTPVVAFNTGGIPDMIEHKVNGYLAEQKNIQDLISGILWVETHPEIDKIKANCRRKALENFALNVVAEKHFNLYRSLIK